MKPATAACGVVFGGLMIAFVAGFTVGDGYAGRHQVTTRADLLVKLTTTAAEFGWTCRTAFAAFDEATGLQRCKDQVVRSLLDP